MSVTSYPLCWPFGWPRHIGARKRPAGSSACGFVFARDKIAEEVRRMRAGEATLSTNCRLLLDGRPRGDDRPADPGVAIYFELNGKPMVMATDYFSEVGSNIWRLAMAMAYLRGLERHGGGTMLERAFAGFSALPEPGRIAPWREVMNWPSDQPVTIANIEAAFKALAFVRHPDRGGNTEGMAELNRAREHALAEANLWEL